MGTDSLWHTFKILHTGCGEQYQPLEKVGYLPRSAVGVPEAFQVLVGFPKIPGIEQVEGVQVRLALLPVHWVKGWWRGVFLPVAVPLRV
jgi:hypothetical protein